MRLALTRRRAVSAVVAASMAAAGVVGLAQSSQAAATYTVASKSGPVATAAVVTINGTGFRSVTNVSNVTAVRWIASSSACSTSATAFTTISVPTAKTVVVSIPASTLTVTTGFKQEYSLCVYNGTTLLGSGKYTVYAVPTITGNLAPRSGPVSGGGTVTVVGTGFTPASVVKFGTTVATNVKVATDGTSLTAKAPAHVEATALDVTVTTEGGVSTAATGTWNDYDYIDAISVDPETGVGVSDVLTITGVGFNALDFTTVNTRVYLVQGAFVAGANATTEVCGTVQVLSDTQLVCTTDSSVADGAYTVYVVGDKTDATTASAITSTATYTVADF